MNKLFLFFIITFGISCDNKIEIKPNFKDFIFINFNLRENSSLKFSGNDTIYLEKRFPEKPIGISYLVLTPENRDTLVKKINAINFSKYNSKYHSQEEDGKSHVFIIKHEKDVDFVSVQGRQSPKELLQLGDYLRDIIITEKFTTTQRNIKFWNVEGIVPPPPPPITTTIKFKSNG